MEGIVAVATTKTQRHQGYTKEYSSPTTSLEFAEAEIFTLSESALLMS